jgi:hypothetical protein
MNTAVTKVKNFIQEAWQRKEKKGNFQPSLIIVPFISSETKTKPCSRNHGNVLDLFSVGQCQFTTAGSLALTSFFLTTLLPVCRSLSEDSYRHTLSSLTLTDSFSSNTESDSIREE